MKSQIQQEMNLEEIRYSMVWEDAELLCSALNIKKTSQVISIASSGCNVFRLLLENPQAITAIDMSPAQIFLLTLKKTAIEHLEYSEFIDLIGLRNNHESISIFSKLKPFLPIKCRNYFEKNSHYLDDRLYFSGRLEKYFSQFQEKILFKIWPESLRQDLWQSATPAEQWKKIEDSKTFPKLEAVIEDHFGRKGLEKGRDPAQMKYVEQENIGQALFKKFVHILQRQLIRENFYLSLFVMGKAPENLWPQAYQEQNFQKLKQQIHKLNLTQEDLETYLLRQADHSIDGWNLSDIFEYMSPEHCQNLFKLLAQKTAPQGKLAYWTLLVDRQPQEYWKHLETKHFAPDQVWFYDQFYLLQKKE